MCDPVTAIVVTGAVIGAAGSVYSGMAANAQGKYEQKIAERNAEMEERSRRDAISRGETEQRSHYRRLAQAMGEARVKNAAAGLDVGFGSAASLEEDIALIGYEDSAAIAENTSKEIRGYDINAANYRSEGKAARMRGKAAKTSGYFNAASTLLGAASQVAGGAGPKKPSSSSSSYSSSRSGNWTGPRY